jgi:excisionase family DNA binding protein
MRTTVSLSEFADMLGVSKRLVYKLIDRDDAPPLIRIGRRVLIRREAAERWLIDREGQRAPAR